VFDTAGDLWSSNANSPFTLVKIGPNQITTTGDPTPTPETTISPFEVKVHKTTDESLAAPNGIAFDEKGELSAISSASPFGVTGYDSKQQMVGGSIKPDVFLVGANTTLNAPAGDNFGPDINKSLRSVGTTPAGGLLWRSTHGQDSSEATPVQNLSMRNLSIGRLGTTQVAYGSIWRDRAGSNGTGGELESEGQNGNPALNLDRGGSHE
jgi:hypothetical protein